MKKKTENLVLALFLIFLGYFFGDISVKIKESKKPTLPKEGTATQPDNAKTPFPDLKTLHQDLRKGRVKYVIDGDTIILQNREKVRYIGIDAPERGGCWYETAKRYNQRLVAGQTIQLEKDKSNRDRYQRLLRYVYLEKTNPPQRIFVNLELIKAGLAQAKEYKPDTKYHHLFSEAEKVARQNKLGLWSNQCAP